MQQTFENVEVQRKAEAKSWSWLSILDYVFYALILLVVVAFIYYLYSYRNELLIVLPDLLQGAEVTIIISLLSMVLATILGFIGALGRLSRFAVLRWIALVYVEVVRGTPILVQLLLWGFAISGLLAGIGFDPYTIAYNFMTVFQSNSIVPDQSVFDPMFYGIIGLSFNYGAYLTEVFRTGIESVNKGQTEAAMSLGLNSRQAMRHIVLPQAFRITIPPFTNYFITLVQDSALLSVVGGVIELQQATVARASALSSDQNTTFFVYIFGATIFLAICYPLALLARYLEGRLGRAY